jgi:hypothetical protein
MLMHSVVNQTGAVHHRNISISRIPPSPIVSSASAPETLMTVCHF